MLTFPASFFSPVTPAARYGLALTPAALRQLLKNRGQLLATEAKRGHLTVRRTLVGKRREVIFIDKDFFFGEQLEDDSQPSSDQTNTSPHDEAENDRRLHQLLDPDWSPQLQQESAENTLPPALASIFQGVYDLDHDIRRIFVHAKRVTDKLGSPGPVINCSTIRVLQEHMAELADEVERHLHPEAPLEDIMEA